MKHDPPNPYVDARLQELQHAISRILGELASTEPRTRDQRAALRDDVRFLLLALSRKLETGAGCPGTPAQAWREGHSAVEAWFNLAKLEASGARHFVVTLAADVYLGNGAERWRMRQHLRPRDMGTNDADLLSILQELEELASSDQGTHGRTR